MLGDIPLMDSPLSVNTKSTDEKLAAYREENACRQYMAMQIGGPYVISQAEPQACREKLRSPRLFKKTWDHYHSKLEPTLII